MSWIGGKLGGHMGAKLSDIPAVKGSIWSVSKKGQQFYKLKFCKLRPKKAQGIKEGECIDEGLCLAGIFINTLKTLH